MAHYSMFYEIRSDKGDLVASFRPKFVRNRRDMYYAFKFPMDIVWVEGLGFIIVPIS